MNEQRRDNILLAGALILGAGVLGFLIGRRMGPSALPDPSGNTETGDLERIRQFYMDDLRRFGWTGSTLLGTDPDQIYAAYLAEYQKLVQSNSVSSLKLSQSRVAMPPQAGSLSRVMR